MQQLPGSELEVHAGEQAALAAYAFEIENFEHAGESHEEPGGASREFNFASTGVKIDRTEGARRRCYDDLSQQGPHAGGALALPLKGLNDRLRQIPSVRAVLLLSLVMIVATVISVAAVLVDLRHKELAHGQGEIVSLTQILAEQTARTFESIALTMRSARERLCDDIGRHFELDSHAVHLLLRARAPPPLPFPQGTRER